MDIERVSNKTGANMVTKRPRVRKKPWIGTLEVVSEAESKTRGKKPHTVGKTRFKEDMLRWKNGKSNLL
jgi:hypothetical protein